MPDNPRIEELRRRIQKDPASIAFAQLAEEHRRGGQYEDAVRVCRAGLAQHPAYLSARITLGRALLEMGRYDEAASEFEYVLKAAPDNLTAVRELADIEQRRGAASQASSEQRASTASQASSEQRRATAASEASSDQRRRDPEKHSADPAPRPSVEEVATDRDPVLAELEAWLLVLAEERAVRSAGI